MIKLVWRSEHD